MIKTDEQKNLADALGQLSYRQTWSLCVQALRAMRRAGDKASTIRWDVTTMERHLYPLMRAQLGIDPSTKFYNLQSMLHEECTAHVLEFLVWLERAGLAYHLGRSGQEEYMRFIRFLPAGLKFFDSDGNDDSPYAHDWTARLRHRCQGLTDEIVSLLDDALACFDRRLLRPSVGLLGVAFEAAFIEVHDTLGSVHGITTTPSKPQRAHEYISAVRSAIDKRIPSGTIDYKDEREAARSACDFADDLRRRRNDASHAGGRSIDAPDEVDELFMQAARKLPHLWQLR